VRGNKIRGKAWEWGRKARYQRLRVEIVVPDRSGMNRKGGEEKIKRSASRTGKRGVESEKSDRRGLERFLGL